MKNDMILSLESWIDDLTAELKIQDDKLKGNPFNAVAREEFNTITKHITKAKEELEKELASEKR